MDLLRLDASKIEKAMVGHIKDNSSYTAVHAGHRNMGNNATDMVYCNAPVDILDKVAMGKTTMRVELYVKKSGGFKNIIRLTSIRDAIVPLFPVKLGNYYFEYISEISGQDDAGYDFIFINLHVIII
jgi:hypothetical protein